MNFAWDDNKFHRARSLVEITGLITERMRTVDNDIKTLNDNWTETKNQLAQLVRKEGNSFQTKDLSEVIYTDNNLKPEEVFVELSHTTFLSTLLVVVHKTKVQQLSLVYEKLYRDENTGLYAAVPGGLRYLGLEDKEGN